MTEDKEIQRIIQLQFYTLSLGQKRSGGYKEGEFETCPPRVLGQLYSYNLK